jgi:hypothetical protein
VRCTLTAWPSQEPNGPTTLPGSHQILTKSHLYFLGCAPLRPQRPHWSKRSGKGRQVELELRQWRVLDDVVCLVPSGDASAAELAGSGPQAQRKGPAGKWQRVVPLSYYCSKASLKGRNISTFGIGTSRTASMRAGRNPRIILATSTRHITHERWLTSSRPRGSLAPLPAPPATT